ncbi:MAG: alpha/beta hydrolase family esterase [Hyphomicrobiaceae bacterium]
MLRFVSVLVALFALTASPSFATDRCGDGGRCVIENGYYLAKLPANWDRKRALPLVVFFHGWNATPEGMFRNRGLVDGVTRRGAIFVAPFAQTGYWRQIGASRAEPGRDELRYVRALMDDINRRWPIDAERTLASGFSRGASMVWNVACYAGPLFKAYLPIGGGFWNSTPETCPTGSIHMRHIHGLKDGVVAYGEVGIYNSMPIPDGLAVLRKLNRCTAQRTATAAPSPRLQCKTWSDCAGGRRLEVCLHGGGHSIPAEWVGEGLDWMRTLIR